MARKVFFSFHYDDVASFRANVVRNSWVVVPGGTNRPFADSSIWEEAKTKGDSAIKKIINEKGLHGTSITTVLIGQETYQRRWVKYEIVRSFEKGNGLLGVHINRIPDKSQRICAKGLNPFDRLCLSVSEDGKYVYFWELVNGKWIKYVDLPEIKNNQSNTLYFPEASYWDKLNGREYWGKSFRFSDFFNTYCWINDEGKGNFEDWIEGAAEQAGR